MQARSLNAQSEVLVDTLSQRLFTSWTFVIYHNSAQDLVAQCCFHVVACTVTYVVHALVFLPVHRAALNVRHCCKYTSCAHVSLGRRLNEANICRFQIIKAIC